MNINVSPSPATTHPRAGHLRDGNKSASVPDFFRSRALELYVIGKLQREANCHFNRALNACEEYRAADLSDALTAMRLHAARAAELAREIERKINEIADDIDDCKTVYAP